jgi:thioester reductase-like protein
VSSLCDVLERRADEHPDRLLFRFHRNGRAVESFSYGDFLIRVRALAAEVEELVPAGERVLLAYAPGLECVAALMACARAGLIAVPVPLPQADGGAAVRRIASIVADCAPSLTLTGSGSLEALRRQLAAIGFAGQIVATDRIATRRETPKRGPGEICFLQYTSGSTGSPQGVVVTHRNLLANARATLDHGPVGASWLPQHHDMGLIGYYLFPLAAGGSSHGCAPAEFLRRPASWLRLISETRATYSAAPNFGFEHCLRDGAIQAQELEGVDLSGLDVLMNASEPARVETIEHFWRRFRPWGLRPDACAVAYGLAENTLAVTLGGRGGIYVDRGALGRREVRLSDASAGAAVRVANCGRPPAGVSVSIRRAEEGTSAGPLEIGEIEVGGASVTPGCWPLDGKAPRRRVRTGDLGFLWRGDLYVCGRLKDVIIAAGVNYFPQDLERAALDAAPRGAIRGACALQDGDGHVVVLAETRSRNDVVEPAALARGVARRCGVMPDQVLIVPRGTLAYTTSGKLQRATIREKFEREAVSSLAAWSIGPADSASTRRPDGADIDRIFERIGGASETRSIGEIGIDSLTLVHLQLEIERLLARYGVVGATGALDGALLQDLTIQDLRSFLERLLRGRDAECLSSLRHRRDRLLHRVENRMRADSVLGDFEPAAAGEGGDLFLTGATGFFGRFLLAELIRQTDRRIHVLVRCESEDQGRQRLVAALSETRLAEEAAAAVAARVAIVPGDLEAPDLGLDHGTRQRLSRCVGQIFHNGARVNYVASYAAMRDANVGGTRRVLDLAAAAGAVFHHVSSTFIFGWTRSPVLYETASNEGMEALDFGYSQSKWVAERLVLEARRRGLRARLYRPSLLSVATTGAGSMNDVALRTLAFMIKHGITVDTPNQLSILPADRAARNLVALSVAPTEKLGDLHLVADAYYNIGHLTAALGAQRAIGFERLPIPNFIVRLNELCEPGDPVYPLLGFFNRSQELIAGMTLKQYDSSAYRAGKTASPHALPDLTVEETAQLISAFLARSGLVP